MQSRPQQSSGPSIRQAPPSAVPPRQQHTDVLQLPSRQPPLDRVIAQITTNPEDSESDSDGSGLECEPDETNSSDEEGSEIPLGASKMPLDDDADPLDTLYGAHHIQVGMEDFYAADGSHHVNTDNSDNAHQGFSANDVSQDPLLGELSLNKRLRFLAYHCRTWL